MPRRAPASHNSTRGRQALAPPSSCRAVSFCSCALSSCTRASCFQQQAAMDKMAKPPGKQALAGGKARSAPPGLGRRAALDLLATMEPRPLEPPVRRSIAAGRRGARRRRVDGAARPGAAVEHRSRQDRAQASQSAWKSLCACLQAPRRPGRQHNRSRQQQRGYAARPGAHGRAGASAAPPLTPLAACRRFGRRPLPARSKWPCWCRARCWCAPGAS